MCARNEDVFFIDNIDEIMFYSTKKFAYTKYLNKAKDYSTNSHYCRYCNNNYD